MKQKYVSGRRALVALFFEGKAIVTEDESFECKIIDSWLHFKPYWADYFTVAGDVAMSALIKRIGNESVKWRILE